MSIHPYQYVCMYVCMYSCTIVPLLCSGNMDTLSDVLKGGAAIANMVNRDGATPLMYATRTGKKQVYTN